MSCHLAGNHRMGYRSIEYKRVVREYEGACERSSWLAANTHGKLRCARADTSISSMLHVRSRTG